MDFLVRPDEPAAGEQLADAAGRSVQDVPLHPGDADVIDEPPPGPITTAVDQDQPPPGLQDAVHLLDRAVLVRVMVEAVRRM